MSLLYFNISLTGGVPFDSFLPFEISLLKSFDQLQFTVSLIPDMTVEYAKTIQLPTSTIKSVFDQLEFTVSLV